MSVLEISHIGLGSVIQIIDKDGHPHKKWNYEANEQGGIGLHFTYFNASSKTIKYITFVFVPYNRVGDVSGESATARFEGPIHPHSTEEIHTMPLWYNRSVLKVKVEKVTIQYMDGSEEALEGKDIGYMYADDSEYEKEERPKRKAREEREAKERVEREAREAKERAEKEAREAEFKKKQRKNTIVVAIIGGAILAYFFFTFWLPNLIGSFTG